MKPGPFSNVTVELGPFATVFDGFPTVNSILVENTRCIRRDLNSYAATNFSESPMCLLA
jgi:hypothetical protein